MSRAKRGNGSPAFEERLDTSLRAETFPLIKCRITVKTKDSNYDYEGLFPSTCEALIAATQHIETHPCKLNVKALP